MAGLDLEPLARIVGAANAFRRETDGRPCVRPASTAEVSECLRHLNGLSAKVTTIGGDTGLVGGTTATLSDVVLSTGRLLGIDPIDPEQPMIVAGAGVTLHAIQDAARDAGFRVGIDLGARGSCTIGGNVATNAGGGNVLRFGMIRRDVVGLEVVLADGAILSDLGGLAKNNAGYDLKQLFIGSEGTLGIVTRAALALHPKPGDTLVALLGFGGFADQLAAVADLKRRFPSKLIALEAMWPDYFEICSASIGSGVRPIEKAAVYLLVEIECDDRDETEATISALPGLVSGAVAQNAKQEALFWAIRDGSDIVERAHPAVHSYDVSLRPLAFESYLARVDASLRVQFPAARNYVFGHLGDGNIHFMVGLNDQSAAAKSAVDEIVYGPLSDIIPSSISAEHGVGVEKAPHLWRSRSAVEIDTMNRLRCALDPKGALNPHIVYAGAEASARLLHRQRSAQG